MKLKLEVVNILWVLSFRSLYVCVVVVLGEELLALVFVLNVLGALMYNTNLCVLCLLPIVENSLYSLKNTELLL